MASSFFQLSFCVPVLDEGQVSTKKSTLFYFPVRGKFFQQFFRYFEKNSFSISGSSGILRSGTWANPEGGGGRGSGPPWKITKIKGFFAILVRFPRKTKNLPSHHSILGYYRHASETQMAFRWRADDDPLIVVFAWIVSPL